MVRVMLTLVFMLIRPACLGLKLGAHLLEELAKAIDWRRRSRRAHSTVRVVHACYRANESVWESVAVAVFVECAVGGRVVGPLSLVAKGAGRANALS